MCVSVAGCWCLLIDGCGLETKISAKLLKFLRPVSTSTTCCHR